MTDTQAPAAPPSTPSGWFTDPADASRLRWWNGNAWTEHVQVPPPQPTANEIASAQAAAAAAQQRAVEAAYVPFSHNWSAEQDAAAAQSWRGGAQTLPGWFLAFSPLWIAGSGFGVGLLAQFIPIPVPVRDGLTIAIALFLVCALANLDAKRLATRGYTRSTSPFWAILLPVFFILRTIRVGVRGLPAAIVAWILCLVVAGVVLLAAIGVAAIAAQQANLAQASAGSAAAPANPVALTPDQRAMQLTPNGMAARIASDFAKTGVELTQVKCQPLPDTNDGSQTRCDVWISSGKFGTVVEQVAATDPYAPFHQVGFTR